MNKLRQSTPLLLVFALTGLISGCALTGGARTQGTTDSEARDRVLRVAGDPPSLGFKRLQYHSRECLALKEFLHARGQPDFIIEDTGFTSRKIVLYYVKPNQAYLVAISAGFTSQKFEVSGPEPIGRQTRALFEALDKLERAEADLAQVAARTKKAER